MSRDADSTTIAAEAAELIAGVFAGTMKRFQVLTHVARRHFQYRDWHAMQRDAGRRLDLYGDALAGTRVGLRHLLGARLEDRAVWSAIRAAFEERVAGRPDGELAETFFNSCVRRVFHTVGVAPDVEFVSAASAPSQF